MFVQFLLTILLATVAKFAAEAIWYTPLFGDLWGRIHGFDKLSKKEQQAMMSKMPLIFAAQFAFTLMTSVALAVFSMMFPSSSLFLIAFWIWLGFTVPAQVSTVLFGGTESKWIVTKSAVLAGGSLVGILAATAVVTFMM